MTDLRFPTGWTALDDIIGDLGPKRFVVVAGVPSAGMTAALLSLTDSVAVTQGVSTLFVDLENGLGILNDRLLACSAGVAYRKVRDSRLELHERARVEGANARIAAVPLTMRDIRGRRTVGRVRDEALRLPRRPALIVIDGTRYLTGPDDYTMDGMARLAADLKNLAGELRCAVVVSHPLQHTSESERRPGLEHFGEMGQPFVDHADHVLIVHRPSQYNSLAESGVLEMRVAKNRHGTTGVVEFAARLTCSRLQQLPPPAVAA